MLALLRQTGLPLHEVPGLKRGGAATSFKVRGSNLKVDLLVPARGKPYAAVMIPDLGAHATALPHLDCLLTSPTASILIGRDRIVPVCVPHPGWFCLHELALYALRARAEDPKREKDVHQAAALAAALMEKRDFLLLEAVEAMDSKIEAKIRPGAERALALVGDGDTGAAELLARLTADRRAARASRRSSRST